MASASDHRAHAALQPADCLILLPQRLPAAVETSIGPAHYPAECTQSDAFLQPSLRARYGRANSNSFRRIHTNSANLFHGRPPLSEIYSDLILARLMPLGAVHTNRRSRFATLAGRGLTARTDPAQASDMTDDQSPAFFLQR